RSSNRFVRRARGRRASAAAASSRHRVLARDRARARGWARPDVGGLAARDSGARERPLRELGGGAGLQWRRVLGSRSDGGGGGLAAVAARSANLQRWPGWAGRDAVAGGRRPVRVRLRERT